jgi:hypothetical protein
MCWANLTPFSLKSKNALTLSIHGVSTPAAAAAIGRYVNAYRITSDVHDNWGAVRPVGINPIVTLGKQLLNMIGKLVLSGWAVLQSDNRI